MAAEAARAKAEIERLAAQLAAVQAGSAAGRPPPMRPAAGASHALCVGIAQYDNAPLKNPVNDAAAVAAALRERGYRVTLLTDQQARAVNA